MQQYCFQPFCIHDWEYGAVLMLGTFKAPVMYEQHFVCVEDLQSDHQ